MDSNFLKIIPLGGCGEIGMNMTILNVIDKFYFIDCGALFPDPSHVGVDLILPDTKFLEENQIQPEAWLITHGHEDHIGALPFIYKKFPAPIYGTEFTIELIKSKFEEAEIFDAIFNVWNYFEPVYFRNIKLTIFPVNHSIAQASGFFIETKLGNVLHMGDFRIDKNPPEKTMTHENIKKVTEGKSVTLMMSDSTNSFQTGTDLSEADVSPQFIEYLEKENGVVLIATFASNIWRLQSILEAAYLTGRKVVFLGKSLLKNTEIAGRLGLLNVHNNVFIDISEINNFPRNEICLICTGSQGESFSGLHRIAWNNIHEFKISEHDTIIFSSRMIPGNEKQIDSLITQFTRIGCKVVTSKENNSIHVSGHGYQEDLIKCIETVKPDSFLPVHGTYRHLKKHREIAISCGIDPQNAYLAENGDVVVVGPKLMGVVDTVTSGRDYVCPGGIFSQNSQIYKDRIALAHGGIVVVSMNFEANNYNLVNDPIVVIKGVPIDSKELAKKVPMIFNNVFDQCAKKRNFSPEILQEDMRVAIRRFIEKRLNFKTNVLIIFQHI
ncbi:ribonuclease J [Pigmentibacter ruber]|uniref:ribonuclease J n=1 Tax=Pigmentibacter ruber TaxID=2683196 RepID=UPI00131E0E4E|nr:ribonuclease J [Pigmentibacter ruber]